MTTDSLVLIGCLCSEAYDLVIKGVIDGVRNKTQTHAHKYASPEKSDCNRFTVHVCLQYRKPEEEAKILIDFDLMGSLLPRPFSDPALHQG